MGSSQTCPDISVLHFKLRYDFRLQSLGYRFYVTVDLITVFTEDCCIWNFEYIDNISLRELQPQLRTIFMYLLRVYDMCYIEYFAVFFPIFSVLSLFFSLSCFFFLSYLLIFTRFKFCFLSFFSSQSFSYGYFFTFQTSVSQHFFNSIDLSFTWALSIQFHLIL